MKKIFLLFIVTIFSLSCSNETSTTKEVAITNNHVSTSKSVASTSNWGDYNVALVVNPDGSEWTYTITKTKTTTKTLSHFIIGLNNCGEDSATFSDVIWATVNDVRTDLSTTEGSGTGCNPQATTTNFIKFPTFSAATSWVLVIKFDRGFETFANAPAWIKAGSSCNQGYIPAPGCPKEDFCSFSQGYFFSNGAENNGSSVLWGTGVTIGGINYTQAQGHQAWDINNGAGKDTTLNAFFQHGAVRLSGAESEVAADVAIIDAYFGSVGNIFNTIIEGKFVLPATAGGYSKSQVKEAGSRIGSFIDAKHCQVNPR